MSMVLMFREAIMRVICAYGSQSGRAFAEKRFCDELAVRSNAEMVLDLGDFNGHVGKLIEGFDGIHEGNGFGERNVEGEMLL